MLKLLEAPYLLGHGAQTLTTLVNENTYVLLLEARALLGDGAQTHQHFYVETVKARCLLGHGAQNTFQHSK